MSDDRTFARIRSWAKEHTIELIEEATGTKLRGGRMPCPLHGGKELNFAVSPSGYYCHSKCEAGGNVVDFLALYRGMSPVDVLRSLAVRAGETPMVPRPHTTGSSLPRPVVRASHQQAQQQDRYAPTKPTPCTTALHGGERPPMHVPNAVCAYPYAEADGTLHMLIARVSTPDGGKRMVCCHPDGRTSGERNGRVSPSARDLVYRLPELRANIEKGCRFVAVVEGEKDVDTLRAIGITATCNPNGAGKWTDAHAEHLRGAPMVAIFADNDETGRAHAEAVRESIERVHPAVPLRVVLLANEHKEHGIKDVTDLVAALRLDGITDALIKKAIGDQVRDAFNAPPVENTVCKASASISDREEEDIPIELAGATFPSSACYGVLGEFVRLWEPHTEAPPVAIYAGGLAALGALIGRDSFLKVSADRHAPRVFVLLIGPSGRARKGVTINIIRDLVGAIEPEFTRERMATGLSSTEGFVNRLRDDTPERQAPNGKLVPALQGVSDKRLLVIEEEFGGVLKVMRRDGSDLSATLRLAWDGRTVQRMTKGDPMTATDPHLVVIGAITPTELREQLKTGEVFNGFANRLLPIYTVSDKCLAFPGTPDAASLASLYERLIDAVRWARAQSGEMSFDPAARQLWGAIYPRLARSNANDERLRVLYERAAPYVLRIALLLALLDRSTVVSVAHLEAALTLWQYAAASWALIFPDTPRHGLTSKLEKALREAGPDGLTRTELRIAAGSNNIAGGKISEALAALAADGLAERCEPEESRGRTAERWRHVWCPPVTSPAPPIHLSLGEMGAMGDDETPPGHAPELFTAAPISPITPITPIAPTVALRLQDGHAGTMPNNSHRSHPSHLTRGDLIRIEGVSEDWEQPLVPGEAVCPTLG